MLAAAVVQHSRGELGELVETVAAVMVEMVAQV
jgi:hypothetical protein